MSVAERLTAVSSMASTACTTGAPLARSLQALEVFLRPAFAIIDRWSGCRASIDRIERVSPLFEQHSQLVEGRDTQGYWFAKRYHDGTDRLVARRIADGERRCVRPSSEKGNIQASRRNRRDRPLKSSGWK